MLEPMRVAIFLVHVILAVVLLNYAFESKDCFVKPTYVMVSDSEIVQHARDSYVFSSWVNVIMCLAVIEWINSSFALYFLNIKNFFKADNDENLGLHFNVILCTVWNLLFIVIMWIKYTSLNLPANNLFLFVFLILAAIAIQNYMARAPEKAKRDQLEIVPDMPMKLTFNYMVIPKLPSQQHHIVFHDKTYAFQLDQNNRGFICRLCAGAITTPLFMVVLLSLIPGTFTWVTQSVFIVQVILNCNVVVKELIESSERTPHHTMPTMYRVINVLLLLTIIFAFYVPNGSLMFTGSSPIPLYARVLSFLMVVVWIAVIVFQNLDLTHKLKHDVWDWGKLVIMVIYVAVIMSNVCEKC